MIETVSRLSEVFINNNNYNLSLNSLVKGHVWENKSYTSLNYLIYSSRALDFAFRKLEFSTKCYAYSNESPFKYYKSILGGWAVWGHAFSLIYRGGVRGQEFGKTCLYNTCKLRKVIQAYAYMHNLFFQMCIVTKVFRLHKLKCNFQGVIHKLPHLLTYQSYRG